MKLQLFIFLFYINYSFSQRIEEDSRFKKSFQEYPKKFRSGLLQYNSAGKYVRPAHLVVKTKKENQYKDYTVFPKPFPNMEHVNHQIVPDSPYFPVDSHPDPQISRSRVKKVLPQYIRNKRSVDDENDSKKSKSSAQAKKISDNANLKVHKGGKNESTIKRLRSPAKLSSKHVSQVRQNAGKKQVSHSVQRKRDLSNKTKTNKPKPTNLQNQKPKQTRIRAPPGRSQKVKSTEKKRPSVHRSNQKRSEATQTSQKTGKQISLSKKTEKKLSKTHRLRSSKNRNLKSKDPNARRLIAGRDALIEDYPYTISIQKDKVHWCSGAILNPRLIITTANCLWRSNSISRMRVRAGSRHTNHGGQVARIQEVMKHPGWKLRRNPDNDVALAVLDKNLRFSNSIHGVDLPNRVMLPPFDDAWVTSWGSDRRDGIFEPSRDVTLQVYRVRLMERDKCNNVTQRFGVSVTANFICLAQTGRRAPCTRDTGAPAVSDGVLWGLASWGIRKLCGTERFPAVFSYLASESNIDFITNATHYLMADKRIYPFLDRYKGLRYTSATKPTTEKLPY